MAAIRMIFMGTPELACASLRALLGAGQVQLQAVVTQPDRPKGRDLRLTPSPVKELAEQAGLPVLQPERARHPEFIDQVRLLNPDLIAVAAYGQILPKELLDVPKFGCLNVHTSLLPKYRGAAPIQWAMLNGEAETGVTIMRMDPGLDTGDIVTQEATAISGEDDAVSLHNRLADLGAGLLLRTIPDYVAGRLSPRRQPVEGVSHARKILKQDGRINWLEPARAIWNRVRGLVPWPGAYTFFPAEPKPALMKIWRATVAEVAGEAGEVLAVEKTGIVVGCGERSLRLLELQREGGRRLSAGQFLSGHGLERGQRLG
jgi:methionyl-tRNA formyltransferase